MLTHAEPTTRPTDISVKSSTKTSVIVKWRHLRAFKAEAIQTFIITLHVVGSYALNNMNISTPYERLSQPEVDIHNLIPGAAYELKIAAVNSEGTGPFSLPFIFITKR